MGNAITKVIYHDIEMNKHEATINSLFYHNIDSVQVTGKYGAIVSTIPVSHTYKIDGNCVDRDTFNEVIHLFKGANSTADFDMAFDNLTHIDKPIKIVFEGESPNTEPILCFHNGNSISVDGDITSIAEKVYKELYESPKWKANNPTLKNKKENEDMPKIVNYKYNEETGTTTLFWADKTQTTVTADNLTEANQFEGFCAACAKKLFGNKSTYLNQFDKWTVRIPERERLAAEKKAKEDKEREETKARKAAKKAERRAKREVEFLAKEFADNYNHESVWEQAKKLAMKKYSVPADYFADDCDCHCNCKEFDVIDEDESNISD